MTTPVAATAYITEPDVPLALCVLLADGGFHRFTITENTLSRLNFESAQALHRIRQRRE